MHFRDFIFQAAAVTHRTDHALFDVLRDTLLQTEELIETYYVRRTNRDVALACAVVFYVTATRLNSGIADAHHTILVFFLVHYMFSMMNLSHFTFYNKLNFSTRLFDDFFMGLVPEENFDYPDAIRRRSLQLSHRLCQFRDEAVEVVADREDAYLEALSLVMMTTAAVTGHDISTLCYLSLVCYAVVRQAWIESVLETLKEKTIYQCLSIMPL